MHRWREVFEDTGTFDGLDDIDPDGDVETGGEEDGVGQILEILKRDPTMARVMESLGSKAEDIVRYQSLGARFKAERENRGLTIKDVARQLKVAQYRVKAVEGSGLSSLLPEVQLAYARLLDLEKAVAGWALANADVARRMGIGRDAGRG